MLVREEGAGALCIGQTSHAWLSGQLARAWGNEAFATPEPWEEVCLGAEQHDIGMAEWDLTPALDPGRGLPLDFMAMPVELHAELWRAAPEKLRTQSRYAALLCSMHATALYGRRERTPVVGELLDHHAAVQAGLLESLGEDPYRARRNQRLLWTWDWLSLSILLEWAPGTQATPTMPGAPDAELRLTAAGQRGFTLDPWPFAYEEIALRAEGRRLRGPCATEAELHAALAAAPWETLSVELRPA